MEGRPNNYYVYCGSDSKTQNLLLKDTIVIFKM